MLKTLRRPLSRTVAFAVLASTLVVLPASPAQSSPWAGPCIVSITLSSFSPDVTTAVTGASYTVSGSGTCPGVAVGIPSTAMSGSGSGTWSCEAALSGGSWFQGWSPPPPDPIVGAHNIVGTWGNWVFEAIGPNFIAVGYLTTLQSPTQCTSGIDSLTMTGVILFIDP